MFTVGLEKFAEGEGPWGLGGHLDDGLRCPMPACHDEFTGICSVGKGSVSLGQPKQGLLDTSPDRLSRPLIFGSGRLCTLLPRVPEGYELVAPGVGLDPRH